MSQSALVIERKTWWCLAWVGLLWLALAVGCSTPQTPVAEKESIFFPPPPAEPRLQFLVSYSSSKDLGENTGGKFASFVVGEAPPPKLIIKPYGLAISAGKLYVCDTIANAIEVLDLEKRQMSYFSPQGQGQLRKPVNISIDRDGTRYVADTIRGQVLIYSRDNKYVEAMGKRGEMKPTDVAIGEDRLYITDLVNRVVRVYDKATRQALFTIPRDPNEEEGKLFSPTNLALDSQGRLHVSDTGAFRILQFDGEGKYLRSIGNLGDRPGEMSRPKGIAVDREGRIYVVDAAAQVVQVFNSEGELLLFFGVPNASAASLDLPAQVVVDYENVDLFKQYVAPGFQLEFLVLVTNQYGPRKVSIYGFVHQQ